MCSHKANRRRHGQALAAVLLLALSCASGAQQTITIRAERAVVDQAGGHALYTGNAELRQGTRVLRAERIEMFSMDNTPMRVEASGDPVTLEDGDTLRAEAKRLVYDVQAEEIRLLENARVRHEGREFEGAEVIYSLIDKGVKATGGEEDGRVRLVIPAEQEGSLP